MNFMNSCSFIFQFSSFSNEEQVGKINKTKCQDEAFFALKNITGAAHDENSGTKPPALAFGW